MCITFQLIYSYSASLALLTKYYQKKLCRYLEIIIHTMHVCNFAMASFVLPVLFVKVAIISKIIDEHCFSLHCSLLSEAVYTYIAVSN